MRLSAAEIKECEDRKYVEPEKTEEKLVQHKYTMEQLRILRKEYLTGSNVREAAKLAGMGYAKARFLLRQWKILRPRGDASYKYLQKNRK